MVLNAPEPIDISDFQFKELCRLKIFEKNADNFYDACNTLAVASRFGLIFIGTKLHNFEVVQVKQIEDLINEVNAYKRRIVALPSRPLHISINCDCTKLAVVVTGNNNLPTVIFYDVLSFFKQQLQVLKELPLSATPGCKILAVDWNPALPDVFTACKDDGSLCMFDFTSNPLELPPGAAVTCFCWSPKGKQLAVGSRDGKITQYKIDLKAVKVTEAPAGFTTIINLCWVSSFQFFGIYNDPSGERASLICVDAPKSGPVVYTNFDDVCYSNGNVRAQQFYLIYQQHWNILMVASSNGTEITVLGLDNGQWFQWILNDNSRAALPLSDKHEETLPIGVTFNVGAHKLLIGDEVKQVPMLLVLSNHGRLCLFHAINSRPGAMDICYPLENVQDRSGDSLYLAPDQQAPAASVSAPVAVPQIPNLPGLSIKPVGLATQQPNQGFGMPLPTTTPELNKLPSASPFGFPQPSTTQQPTSFFGQNPPAFQTPPQSVVTPPQPVSASVAPQPIKPPISIAAKIEPPSPAPVTPETPTADTIPVTEETEAIIAELIRKECRELESELYDLIKRTASIDIKQKIGSDAELTAMAKKANDIEEFYKELKENINTHDAEVYTLKQNLIETWGCNEEAHTRYKNYKDPVSKASLRSMPLDPASQHQLDDINHMVYYIESQLIQANQCLDEQWDSFQDVLMKSNKLKLPTLESIYQTLVQHSKIMQKQRYILKHISARVSKNKSRDTSLLIINNFDRNDFENLENELTKLKIVALNKTSPMLKQQPKISKEKTQRLLDALANHEVTHVATPKPQHNSSALLSSLLAAPLSPIGKTKTHLAKWDNQQLVNSTPKVPQIKTAKIPVQTFTPTTQQSQMGVTPNAFSARPIISSTKPLFGVPSAAPKPPMAVPSYSIQPVPGPGNTSPVKPIGAVSDDTTSPFSFTAPSSGIPSKPMFVTEPSTTSFVAAAALANNALFKTTSANVFKPAITVATVAATPFAGFGSATATKPFDLGLVPAFGMPLSTPATAANTSEKPLFGSSTTATEKPLFGNLIQTPAASSAFGFGTTTISGAKASEAKPATMTSPRPPLLATPSTGMTTPQPLSTAAATTAPSATGPSLFGKSSFGQTTGTSIFGGAAKLQLGNVSSSTTLAPVEVTTTIGPSSPAISNTTNTDGATVPTAGIFASFGKPTTPTSDISKSTTNIGGTGSTASSFSGSLFGSSSIAPSTTNIFAMAAAKATANIFGTSASSSETSIPSGNIFATATPSNIDATVTAHTISSASVVAAQQQPSVPTTTTTSAPTLSDVSATTTKSIFGGTPTSPIFGGGLLPPPSTTAPTPASGVFASLPTPASTTVVATTTTAVSTFGSPTTTTSPPAFGATVTTSAAAISLTPVPTPAFGAPTSQTQPITTSPPAFGAGGIFGGASSAFGATPSVFPQAATTASQPIFAGFGAAAPTATTPSVFGAPATTSQSIFSPTTQPQTAFGSPTATATPFGTQSTTQFGQTAFAAAAAASAAAAAASPRSPFAQTPSTTTTPFGGSTGQTGFNTGSLFSQPATFGTTTGSIFGGGTPTTSASFGSPSTVFGQPANSNSPFAQQTTGGAFGSSPFGAAATAPVATTASVFGGQGASVFGSPPTGGGGGGGFGSLSVGSTPNTFGQPPAGNPFARAAEQKSPFGGTTTNLFAAPATTANNLFGSPTQSTFGAAGNTSFGNSSFGQQSTFGSSSFGASPSGPFNAGASGQTVQQSGFGGAAMQKSAFGSAPVFGQSAFGGAPSFGGSPTFGGGASFGSPQKVFGAGAEPTGTFGGAGAAQNSTFGSLANQSTVGFGNLAQQAQQQSGSMPFSGGTSFTNWRN